MPSRRELNIMDAHFRRAADLVSGPKADRNSGLIIAGTHGDENSSVVTLSCALRTLAPIYDVIM